MIIAKSTPSRVYKMAQALSVIMCLFLFTLLVVAISKGNFSFFLPLLIVEILLVAFLSYMYLGQVTSVSVNTIEVLVNTRFSQIVIPSKDIIDAGFDKVDYVPVIQLLGVKMFPGGLLRFFSSDYKNDRFFITDDKKVFFITTKTHTYHISNDQYKDLVVKLQSIVGQH